MQEYCHAFLSGCSIQKLFKWEITWQGATSIVMDLSPVMIAPFLHLYGLSFTTSSTFLGCGLKKQQAALEKGMRTRVAHMEDLKIFVLKV